MDKTLVKRTSFSIVWQSAAIVILSVILGIGANQLRSDKLAWVADWSQQARLTLDSGESLAISPEDAEVLFFAGTAVFLDARSPEFYELGHIQGAYNLPWEDFEAYFDSVMTNIPPDTPIITYCDGTGCSLSKELALVLKNKGYTNVRVLVNGWTVWQQNDLPTEFGQ